MKYKWKKAGLFLCILFLLLILPVQNVGAASRYPSRIKLNRTKVSALVGDTVRLKVTTTPKKVEDASIVWESSNEEVAVVSEKGKVTVTGLGTAKITAVSANGKKAHCTVRGVQYVSSNGKVRITTPDGVKTYQEYKQNQYGLYYRSFGCVTTAVAMIASGYGKNYTPRDIHEGAVTKKYSERYALKKMKASAALYNRAAMSLMTASRILKNIGISNKVVYKYKKSEAYREIKAHLLEGKPVMVKANNNTHKGIRLANAHHALVLIGLDENENIIYLDPSDRSKYKIKLKTLIKYHMTPAEGKYKTPHVVGANTAGGYILVG